MGPVWLLTVGFGRRQAVLFRFLFIDMLFKFAFHSTRDSGTVYSGGRTPAAHGGARLTLCSLLVMD